ncbi:DJC76, partial [Symbiodinium sp. CCMP2456]
PVSLPDDADDLRSPFSGIAPVLLNEKFVVHSYDGGSQQSRSQYDVKHVLIPTLEPFHCSDRGCKFNLVLKCSEDFTLTHFYISGPGPRCTEPIRSGLVWVCSDLPKDLEITDVYDDLRPDELESHQPMDEDRGGSCTNESSSTWDPHPPILRFQTDVESREAEVELQRWQEGRYVIVRFLDTHFAEEQVNVDVGMIGLVGHFGRCGRHQVPVGPWMRRRVQQAWVHARPLQRTFSSGGWVCDGRDFTGGCRASLTDFHQTTMYNSRFHCSVTGFDLCEACAHDTSLGKVTDASVQADIEALQSASTCKLVGTRLRNLWKRNWLHAIPRYFRHGLLQRVMASLQSCLDHLTQSGRARAILEEEASGRGRGRLASTGTVLHPDPQQSAALRALLQLVSDLVHSILVGVRPGCDIQVNDLAWAPVVSDVHGPPCRWERCRVISLPPNFPAVNPSSTCPNLEEDDDMDASAVASASFLVSSRDWKGKRQVQAENLWKVTKQLNDEDAGWQQTTACPSEWCGVLVLLTWPVTEVVITTAGLLTEVRRGAHCDVNEAAASNMCLCVVSYVTPQTFQPQMRYSLCDSGCFGDPGITSQPHTGPHLPAEDPGRTTPGFRRAWHQQFRLGRLPCDARLYEAPQLFLAGVAAVTASATVGAGSLFAGSRWDNRREVSCERRQQDVQRDVPIPPESEVGLATSAPVDLYELFGTTNRADEKEIKKKYYDLQKLCHPDVAGPEGEEMCILLNDAWDLLSDEDKRKDYVLEYASSPDMLATPSLTVTAEQMVEDKGALPCPLSARQGMAKEPLWDPFSAANSFTAKLADEERRRQMLSESAGESLDAWTQRFKRKSCGNRSFRDAAMIKLMQDEGGDVAHEGLDEIRVCLKLEPIMKEGSLLDVSEIMSPTLYCLHIAAGSARLHGSQFSWQMSVVEWVVFAGGPDQSDRSGQTALQLLQKTITLGSSMDEASSHAIAEQHLFHRSLQVSNAEQCTQLLRRHGAEPCAWALESCVKALLGAETMGIMTRGPYEEVRDLLRELPIYRQLTEDLATEVLGPLLALRGTSSALQGFRPPPLEALEVR